jgi:hypothetical protein
VIIAAFPQAGVLNNRGLKQPRIHRWVESDAMNEQYAWSCVEWGIVMVRRLLSVFLSYCHRGASATDKILHGWAELRDALNLDLYPLELD